MSSTTTKELLRLIKRAVKRGPVRVLEIGTASGQTTTSILSYICANSDSIMWACDPFVPYTEKPNRDNEAVYEEFMENTSRWQKNNMLNFRRQKSFDFLLDLNTKEEYREYFDFIYIDGNHKGRNVLEDMVLSHPLVKKGGYIILDDYKWTNKNIVKEKRRHPSNWSRNAIDIVAQVYSHDYEIIKKASSYRILQKVENQE
tara:strand:- start:77 stop:679 length:603 start_codon:yes stop_codon:yes gene_type:complete